MVTFGAGVKIHEVGAIELVDAIHGVVGGMAVDQIHDDHDSHGVSLIDQKLP